MAGAILADRGATGPAESRHITQRRLRRQRQSADTVTIAANRLTHVQASGSATALGRNAAVQLRPPQLLE